MEYQKLVDLCNQMSKNTLMETLQITYTAAGEGWLQATMPVNSRVHQPMGLLHGGAMVALAESVGSAASVSTINTKEQEVRGIEIAANHLKSVREGVVTATAKIIHQGKSLHLWEIRIENEKGELVSLCKLTNMILSK
ncbi:MAG: PaaI family thioesterase [Flavobacterium sp.]